MEPGSIFAAPKPNAWRKRDENLENVPYQQAIGVLMFLFQGTRPDLAFAISQARRFNNNFNSENWGMVSRIFRYLKSRTDLKLVYRSKGNFILTGYCDAS